MPSGYYRPPDTLLPWPDEPVPWLWQLSNDELLQLVPDDIIWCQKESLLHPCCISRLPAVVDGGIQIYYTMKQSSHVRTIANGNSTGYYRVDQRLLRDREQREVHEARTGHIKLVASGGGGT